MQFKSMCYHQPEEVANIDDVIYMCSDRMNIDEFQGDAIINLSGHPNIPQGHLLPRNLSEHINKYTEELIIAWGDFKSPNVKSSFWKALHEHCLEAGWKRVCIHCDGGHGRTGTALAAIIICNLGFTAKEAVNYVREQFCVKAVETGDQVIYLCKLDEEVNGTEYNETKDYPVPSIMMESHEQ